MHLSAKHIDKLLEMVENTCDDEPDCQEVLDQLDVYVDCIMKSGEKTEVIKRIDSHLKNCRDCAEEYSLLKEAIEAAEAF